MLHQRILTYFEKESVTVQLTSYLTKQVNLLFIHHNQAAESKQIKQEASRSVILTLTNEVSIL